MFLVKFFYVGVENIVGKKKENMMQKSSFSRYHNRGRLVQAELKIFHLTNRDNFSLLSDFAITIKERTSTLDWFNLKY